MTASTPTTSVASLLRFGAVSGVMAAAATTVLALVGRAAGASLEVEGESIPIAAFALWTIVAAAVGILMARVLRTRRRFVLASTLAAAASLIPPLVAPDDFATKVTLVTAHVVAAAIIIPALSRALPTS